MNLLSIVTVEKDGVAEKVREFLSYPSKSEALSALYNKMWYYVSNKDTVNAIVEIINDNGDIVKRETYVRTRPASEVIPAEGGLE